MSILRQNPGDVVLSFSIYRDGERLKNSSGNYELAEFVRAYEVYESITSATMEAMMIIEDSGGLIGTLTGSEVFRVQIKGSIIDRTYFMRTYQINSRSRTNQSGDIYIVNMASDEYIKNEVTNVFGNTDVIFNNNTETTEIVKNILTNKKYLGTRKRLFLEKTLNNHRFIIPNWRPFDAIYWMAQRSIRPTNSGGVLQNGFAFYENALGYNFKSIDYMIEQINQQESTGQTNTNTGTAKLYKYEQSPKSIDDGTKDQFRITKVVFPEEKNFLSGLRDGAWSGFSIGFDPNTISNSKYGESTDMSVDAYRYSISETWSKMSHLKGGKDANPINSMDKEVQAMIGYPKRVRYSILPNQIFDPKFKNQKEKNYEQLVELQAYQWMRMEALRTIKLQIEVPGNLDLYAGMGIEVIIPGTFRSGSKTEVDQRYSGRYLIASLTHKTTGSNMVTELALMKDALI
ncbi:hypothetical protein [Synechococcus phage S-RS29]|nr:hypothetical protein [Synechococcus phage S-RS29]